LKSLSEQDEMGYTLEFTAGLHINLTAGQLYSEFNRPYLQIPAKEGLSLNRKESFRFTPDSLPKGLTSPSHKCKTHFPN